MCSIQRDCSLDNGSVPAEAIERGECGDNNIVLCGASSYEQKYYFNKDFERLPEAIRKELRIMCVTFTEEAGGILTVEFDPDGELKLKVRADDSDYLFDDIESGIQISRLQREKEKLFEQLELFYQLVYKK